MIFYHAIPLEWLIKEKNKEKIIFCFYNFVNSNSTRVDERAKKKFLFHDLQEAKRVVAID